MTSDRLFAPLLNSYAPNLDFWATGAFPSHLAGALGAQLQSALQMIQAFTIKLSGDDKTRFGLILRCATGEAAQANAAILKNLLGSLAQDVVDTGYNIPDLLNALKASQIVVEGTSADFKMEMTKAELAATAKAFQAEPTAPAPPAFGPLPPGIAPRGLGPLR